MQSFTALIVAMAVSGATVPVNTSLDMAGSSDSALASEAGGGPEGLAEQALFEAETHAVAAEPGSTELAIWPDRAHTFGSLEQHQVRIERRVIIRVAPRRHVANPDMLSELQSARPMHRMSIRKRVKCVPTAEIGGVQADPGNQLILFMRRHRMVGVSLEKGCRARDFYSGFYVERSPDGLICSGRDVLHSRAGARCEVSKLYVLARDKN